MFDWLLAFIVSAGWRDVDSDARVAMKNGRIDEAEAKWKEAVALAETEKELDPGVVDCLIGLAGAFDKRGDSAESERLYELAMRTVEGVKGGDSSAYADRLPELALLYRRHGKSWHSDIIFQRLIKIRENTSGKNSAQAAKALELYGSFLSSEGREAESQKIRERAHTIKDSLSDSQ